MTARFFQLRPFLPLAVAVCLVGAAPVFGQPTDANAPAASTNDAARQARIQQHLERRLQRMAERLQITPAQQAAWSAYAGTVQSLIGTGRARPAPDADAASIVRLRAQLAAERAQKLSQLADATASLQQVLDPEQQKTLDEIVRHAGHRAPHRRDL